MNIYRDLKSVIQLSPNGSSFNITSLWNESRADKNKSYLIIKDNGGPIGKTGSSDVECVFVSPVNPTGNSVESMYQDASDLSKWLYNNQASVLAGTCLFSVSVTTGANTPRKMADNRFASTFNLRLLYSSGYVN